MAAPVDFTSGDLIALFVGSIGAMRWIADKFFSKTENDDERFLRLELDYERFKAARVEIDKNNTETLARLDRGVQDVQSQIRLLVTGAGDQTIEIHRK